MKSNQNSLKSTKGTSPYTSTKTAIPHHNPFPRTVRLSIPEMQDKNLYHDNNKNSGCITYKEPRKEQSPENPNLNSGKILSNKIKAINLNLDIKEMNNERKRSKSPFVDESNLLESVKNVQMNYKNMNENAHHERKLSHYESNRDEKISIKEILKNNFFKENSVSHNKTNSVNYEVKNLLYKGINQLSYNQNQMNCTQNQRNFNQTHDNSKESTAKHHNNPENKQDFLYEQRERGLQSQEKNSKHYKENINETPFGSLAREKFAAERSLLAMNERKNIANQVPISSFVNHMNLRNVKVSCNSPTFNINLEIKGD